MVVLETEQIPDSTLVADAQRGSVDAFAALYERHHERILRHCRARIGSGDAPDAAQETFLRAWRAIDRFGGDGRFQPWLRTIATNVCIDLLRRSSRSVPVAEVDVPPTEDVDLAALAASTEALTAALASLSERQRSVLELREWEGWTYERIADHEQLDLSAVKSLLWRARQSLRRELLLASAQGRLAAMAGLLSMERLRSLLGSDGGASVATASSSGAAMVGMGGAAAVAVAAVAVPVLAVGPSSTPPPPPVAAPAVATTTTAPPTPGVVRVALARPTPTTVVATLAPPTTTSTTVAPLVVTMAAATVEEEPTRDERRAERVAAKQAGRDAKDAEKAEREAAREQERADREAAKQAERDAKERDRADREAARQAERDAKEQDRAQREAAKEAEREARDAERAVERGGDRDRDELLERADDEHGRAAAVHQERDHDDDRADRGRRDHDG